MASRTPHLYPTEAGFQLPSPFQVSVSVSAQDSIVTLGKAHTRSAPSLSSLPKVALETLPIFAWLNTYFSTLEGRMSATSFLHSSFLQAVNAVMLWLVCVEKVPQASAHLCPAKLQIRCGICCACQSICPFIPTDSGVPRSPFQVKIIRTRYKCPCFSSSMQSQGDVLELSALQDVDQGLSASGHILSTPVPPPHPYQSTE